LGSMNHEVTQSLADNSHCLVNIRGSQPALPVDPDKSIHDFSMVVKVIGVVIEDYPLCRTMLSDPVKYLSSSLANIASSANDQASVDAKPIK